MSERLDVPPLTHCWECPRCGAQIACTAHITPPRCIFGHPPTEMEQVAMPRFGIPFEVDD